MKRTLTLLIVLITLLSVSIIPAYADDIEQTNDISTYAGTVQGQTYPITFVGTAIASLSTYKLQEADYFTITVNSDEIVSYTVYLGSDFDGWTSYETFTAGNICKISEKSLKSKHISFMDPYFDVKIRARVSGGDYTTNFSYTIDVEEKSSIMLGIIDYLKGAFNDFQDFFAGLFQGIFDFIDSIKELWDAKDKFLENFVTLISSLWELVKSCTLEPINNFLDSLSNGAISIWLSFFDFPIIKELTVALVTVSLISGFFTLFITV